MIELIRGRRSIRSFTPQPVEAEKTALLIEAALRSPSSRNINPWQFIVVDDRELLGLLASAKQHGSAFLKGAPLGIVVCADTTCSDVWVEDCSIAAIMVQMTAHSLGLGSCWIQIRLRQHSEEMTSESWVREQLGLPGHMAVAAIIAVGYPDRRREPLPESALQQDKVHRNRYGAPYRPI